MSTAQAPARVIVIPADGRDKITEEPLPRPDGGLRGIEEICGGDNIETETLPGRGDVTVYFDTRHALRNNRATMLMRPALSPGAWIAGNLVLAGEAPDGGLVDLPEDVTVTLIEWALGPQGDA